jgi:endonuclease YncB( thermonuclease family)
LTPLLLAALPSPPNPARAETLAGSAIVIDGRTIEVDGQAVRLLDLDAPAIGQHCRDATGADYGCGERAAAALSDHLHQRKVSCDWAFQDREGRRLGRCTLAGKDVALWLIRQGWGLPDRDCKCEAYREAAGQAKAKHLGLWAGSFDMPWIWRQPSP